MTMLHVPTWRVWLHKPIYNRPQANPFAIVEVSAYTGPAAEEVALEARPGWKVTRCERWTGFDGVPEAYAR